MIDYSIYKKSRISYIIEAALEYFISILVTDSFLAALLTKSGVNDAATGIITQLASLAFVAQMFSVFVNKTRGLKKFVTILHIINQLMFVLLYLVPVFDIASGVKLVLFVVFFLGGHFISQIVFPYKFSWLMSLMPDKSRGRFSANKEIVSLVGGMAFSFVMGTVSDYYNALGKENISFMICGITIFVLTVLHTVSLVIIKDAPETDETVQKESFKTHLKNTFSNKALMKLIAVDVLWHCTTGIAVSFYGIYKINELGFSLQYVSILSIMYSVARVAFSRFFGKYADTHSWANMLFICFWIAAVSFLINVFTVPENGKVMFAIYYCIYAVAMAGINSGLMNIAFDYVKPCERAGAIGIKYAIGGFASFFASIVGGVILTNIQNAQNMIFGIHIYAQQFLSLIAFIICVILSIYMKNVICKIKVKQNR